MGKIEAFEWSPFNLQDCRGRTDSCNISKTSMAVTTTQNYRDNDNFISNLTGHRIVLDYFFILVQMKHKEDLIDNM